MPIIILAGEEELLIEERVEELKQKLLDPAWTSFNFSRIDGGQLKDVVDAAAAIPFGPGNKLILFDRCLLFTKKKGAKSTDEDDSPSKSKKSAEQSLTDLDQALAHIHPNTYLVFACQANFDKTLKTSKVFEKHTKPEEFPALNYATWSKNEQLFTWARKRAHKFGALIEDEAIIYLAESTDADLRQMSSDIEKAATYLLPETKITLAVVSELSPHHSTLFALLDHWLAGRKHAVLESLEELTGKQQSVLPIMAGLQTTLSKWILIKTHAEELLASLPGGRGIQRRTLPAMEIAKRIEGPLKIKAWLIKNDLERIEKVELSFLIEKKQQLTKLESMIKFGQIRDQQALSLFFVC